MFIKREILTDLTAHLTKKEISLLVGPRQAGKTTIMLYLRDQLLQQAGKVLSLSFDFERDRPHLSSQDALLERARLEFGRSEGFIFIDEIQRKQDAGLFLKGLYDLATPYKFVVSGSGSLELREKIHESLAGRKRIFKVSTVSFKEFANFKTGYRYADRLGDYFRTNRAESLSLLTEYLNFGGYPRVILEETLLEKLRTIDEIYVSYLEKDIAALLRVEHTEAFGVMLRVLAGQIGNIINVNELSSTLGISIPTVKKYLSYAEKTYILKRITPFFTNIRKEIGKSPVPYFMDVGLRNFVLNRFDGATPITEMGFVFQNLVHNVLEERASKLGGRLNFWRTKDKSEVDFVLQQAGKLIPVEVKCRDLREPVIPRPLRGFIENYRPEEAWVVNLSLAAGEMVGKTAVRFKTIFEIL